MDASSPSALSERLTTDYAWLQERYTTYTLMGLTRLSRYFCKRILSGTVSMPDSVAVLIARDSGRPNSDFDAMTKLRTATYDATALQDLMDAATTHCTVLVFCGTVGITIHQYSNARFSNDRGIALITALLLARHFAVPVESLITLKE